jgi:ABC-type amino acid transport system permease subunit
MVFWTTLLIIHGLLAVALLGAITHQTVALWWPVRAPAGSFVARFRGVPSTSYVMAIIVLYLVTFVMGAWIYTQYRFTSRLALEQLRFFKTVGVFEMKEHLATIGMILLPAYWAFWRRPLSEDYAAGRKHVTLLLAILIWANFLIGHITNNARGFGS